MRQKKIKRNSLSSVHVPEIQLRSLESNLNLKAINDFCVYGMFHCSFDIIGTDYGLYIDG